ARSESLAEQGIDFLDVGTSGGVFGLERGYCLMIGGPEEPVARLDPAFRSLAPGVEAATRTKDDGSEPRPAEVGHLHCRASDEGVPAPILSNARYERFGSRGEGDFANRLLSAMRQQFGGHVELAAKGSR